MRFLLDTCVVSELRQPQADPNVLRAVDAVPAENLFLSVVTTGELAKGIALLRDGKRRQSLREWFLTLEQFYSDRILPLDLEASHIWGELTATAQKLGKVIPASDGLIAATALRHGLHLMTRNTAHFATTGVLLLNPWQE